MNDALRYQYLLKKISNEHRNPQSINDGDTLDEIVEFIVFTEMGVNKSFSQIIDDNMQGIRE